MKNAAKIAGTVLVLLTAPLWVPVCFVVYEVNWKGMWADLVKMHKALWH